MNSFAIELYKKLGKNNSNVFFSPYSIETALAMAYEGARGTTREEMGNVLHFPEDNETRWKGFRELIASLNAQDKPYILTTANALWVQRGCPIKENYLDIVRKYYLGEVRELDFRGNPKGAEETINRWVDEKTKGRIKNIVRDLDPETRLIITNAVYFKANWSKRFDPADTTNESFTLVSGEKITVPMMHQTNRFNYTENEELQALEMPYEGDRFSMVIILPRKNSLSSIENNLTPDFIQELTESMRPEEVKVIIPKFRFEASYSLREILMRMGMRKAFGGKADFSGISEEPLFISDVIHKSFISVAENGTEAAAVTTAIMVLAAPSGEQKYKVFRADHPFIFLIYDRETGAVLFIGRLMDPRG